MITEKDLQEAIAECQGDRHPTASTCIKLAAFYTIKDHLFPDRKDVVNMEMPTPAYSYAQASESVGNKIQYESDTEFGRLIYGRDPLEVWPMVDELVSKVISVINPRLYDSFIRRLK